MKKVDIYCDGACSGNPGQGGYGVILKYKGNEKQISGGYSCTTNNRMEIMAAIVGLEALKESCNVTIYSDSKYLVDSVQKGWVFSWKSKNWKKSDGKMALNIDLWERLLAQLERHNVEFVWIKGHDGHEENERCDKMAVLAYKSENLLEDIKLNT